MGYRKDRKWSDQFIPQIKEIVGPHLLEITSDEIDCQQAADLMIFIARDMRIAARIRRPGYEKYKYEFTIRAKRDTGKETELKKIVDGWGDWMFYGHANHSGKISIWWILSLHALRAALIRHKRKIVIGDKSNGDGTYFKYFDIRSFPNIYDLVIDSNIEIFHEEKLESFRDETHRKQIYLF